MKTNKKYVTTVLLLIITVAVVGMQSASALSPYLGNFEAAYPVAAGSKIDNCNLCHNPDFSRNPFGLDFKANGFTFTDALESMDSDGDGFSNIDEINALTFPGDAGDQPVPTPVLATITVTPGNVSLIEGETQVFTAETLDQFGKPMNATITWFSSDMGVGLITGSGLLTSVSAGTTTITASSGTVSGTATVTVTASSPSPVLTTITVTPGNVSLIEGETQVFTAEALDQFGNPIAASITWKSNDTGIGTIDNSGLFTAVSAGTATVIASSGPINGTSSVTVTALSAPGPVPEEPAPSPAPVPDDDEEDDGDDEEDNGRYEDHDDEEDVDEEDDDGCEDHDSREDKKMKKKMVMTKIKIMTKT